ncbi:hypothetical protein [Vallitalea okinawensis]|uniref:hypothetical protein n=1 Tax=Vallitalea okinawensis TaxID=2078660 RepID=UPI000CFE1C21|nr:hypothetical protein [Vallitalea okinawensis]
MKKEDIKWTIGAYDPTGFLHSFPKSLALSLKVSNLSDNPEDIIATSGFAFRIWVDGKTLCPSAMSIFDFKLCHQGVENGGYTCTYIDRLWDEQSVEEERRLHAIKMIKEAVDSKLYPIVWDIGIPEWGLITGYDESKETLSYLSITGEEGNIAYTILGRREIPILSVTIPKEKTDKSEESILIDTIKLAIRHAKGEEWCENADGLEAYKALTDFFTTENIKDSFSFSTQYYLGTYASLRYHAWKYLLKASHTYPELIEVAKGYEEIYQNLKSAFDLVCSDIIHSEEMLMMVQNKVRSAGVREVTCIDLLESTPLLKK